ncbi:tripartite tricarboxylate transporter TctB family protein [Nonomuraea insulae]|uniref:Tripartite tricarboxylate transporter TctB family protein n=1 Tax=Nonomuraea insulae TaxID=1616787 RepID=A0ABW1D0R5_9ACTN
MNRPARTTDDAMRPDGSRRSETPERPEAGEEASEEIRPAGAWASVVAALAPGVFGAAMAIMALSLGLGRLSEPGAGLWPFALGVLLVAVSVALLTTRRRQAACESFGRGGWSVVLGAVSLVAFIMLLPLVGFEIPTVVLIALWLKVIGGEGWRTTVAVSVLATAGFHALFVLALGVSIPHLIAI